MPRIPKVGAGLGQDSWLESLRARADQQRHHAPVRGSSLA
jgi:hypothetical protein